MKKRKISPLIRRSLIFTIYGAIFSVIPHLLRLIFPTLITEKGPLYLPLYLYGVIVMLPIFYLGLVEFHKIIYTYLINSCHIPGVELCPSGLIFTILLLVIVWSILGFVIGFVSYKIQEYYKKKN